MLTLSWTLIIAVLFNFILQYVLFFVSHYFTDYEISDTLVWRLRVCVTAFALFLGLLEFAQIVPLYKTMLSLAIMVGANLLFVILEEGRKFRYPDHKSMDFRTRVILHAFITLLTPFVALIFWL